MRSLLSPGGCELDMLFLADVLWSDPFTNSGESKDLIDSLYIPDRYDPIKKLYEVLGNQSYTTTMNALNEGYNIINHDGHANHSSMSVGTGYLMESDMDALTNGPRYSIMFSIGCFPASFDLDCIAEHFLVNPNGGGVAFIGNSRYGWGSPGNPLYGYSDRFDRQFFKQLFVEDIFHIGHALAAAKAVYVPFSSVPNVYRWCEYQTNLLGDPEMPVWTDSARQLAVEYPAELSVGNSFCRITVTDGDDPVEGALVCLMQDTIFYDSDFTDHDGEVEFEVSTPNAALPVDLTVTAHNFFPYQSTMDVITHEPYVKVSSYSTKRSENGFVTPGALNYINAYFKNYGNKTAHDVSALLRCENGLVTMNDSTESIRYILPGDSVRVLCAFSFHVDGAFANGDVIYFNLEISDSNDGLWADKIGTTVATPVLSFSDYIASDDAYGDGDGFAEPGEGLRIEMRIENSGLSSAHNVTATIACGNPYINVENTNVIYWNIPPLGFGQTCAQIEIETGCPEPLFPQIDLSYRTQDGYAFEDSFTIAIGEVGFMDDMESGESGWTHSGSYDYWHLSSHRKHSGSFSWYAGYEGLFTYTHAMDAVLKSPPFVLDENSELSFWGWYEFPNFGTDGCYVDVNDGSGWATLDFIGSGGALGTLPTTNRWLEYTYDLSHYPAGTSMSVRFRFVSDLETLEEGMYIDDVVIGRRVSGDVVISVPPTENLTSGYYLYQNYPNPFNPNTIIRYELGKAEHVLIDIFDIQGARVRVLENEAVGAGPHMVMWDGKNEKGINVSSGVYLYRITAGEFRETKKMVLIR